MSEGRVPRLSVAPGVLLTDIDPLRPCGERIKGFSFQTLLAVCQARYGPSAFSSWAVRYGLDQRAIAASASLPIEYLFSLAETVINERHGGETTALVDLASECVTHEINGFFRFVLGFTSPTTLLRLGSRFWRQYYDRSELVVVEAVGNTLKLELRGWGLMNATAAYVHCGAMLRWLEICRAPSPRFTSLEFAAPGLLKLSATW
jgi:hypothetical protein